MSFLIFLNQFNTNNVYLEPATVNAIPHAIPHDAKFYRITYSTPRISLNPVGCVVHLVPTKITQHYNHKWSIQFDASHPVNAGIIDQFRKIETDIVNKFMHSGLVDKRQCVFANGLTEGMIKTDYDADVPSGFASLSESQFVLYITGVWESQTEYGISCRFAKW
jgi:hypothetical protein|uniref:Uncharacterized protein n=1 Tax=viral metagenome TaxID=1070528 RepID=A0A6C0M2Q8_9ZZZZ